MELQVKEYEQTQKSKNSVCTESFRKLKEALENVDLDL